MTMKGSVFICNDGYDVVCYEKKAHVAMWDGSDDHGPGWSVGPCDGTCAQKEEEIPDEIVGDLTAFLKDGQPRSVAEKGPDGRLI